MPNVGHPQNQSGGTQSDKGIPMTGTVPREALVTFCSKPSATPMRVRGMRPPWPPCSPGTKNSNIATACFSTAILRRHGVFCGTGDRLYQNHPVWSMSYAGGVIAAVTDRAAIEAIYACLRLALRQGTVVQPYRGPTVVREGSTCTPTRARGRWRRFGATTHHRPHPTGLRATL